MNDSRQLVPQIAHRPQALRANRSARGRDLLARTPVAAAAGPTHSAGVLLRGIGLTRGGGSARPTLVARRDDDFLAGLQADLAAVGGVQALLDAAEALERDARGRLRLFPPVQRVHQLVLVEACCPEPGFPRLDPARIESAGLVLRQPAQGGGWLAWLRAQGKPLGWRALGSGVQPHRIHERDDPDATRRPPRALSGNPHIDAALRAQRLRLPGAVSNVGGAGGLATVNQLDEASERIVPLHPLPPALCQALGRTLLVGYLPVASDEVVEPAQPKGATAASTAGNAAPVRAPADVADLAALSEHLMHYLKAGNLKALPRAGQQLLPSWLETLASSTAGAAEAADGQDTPRATGRWLQALMQLHLEFDAFADDAGSNAHSALGQALAALRIVTVDNGARAAAGDLLEAWLTLLCQIEPSWSPAQTPALLQRNTATGRFDGAGHTLVSGLLSLWRQRMGLPLGNAFGNPLTDLIGSAGWQAEALALQRIERFLLGTTLQSARPWLSASLQVLTGDDPPALALRQADYWAPVSASQAETLLRTASERLRQREAALFAGGGNSEAAASGAGDSTGATAVEGGRRLSEPDAPFAVRCFVRLKPEGGCPPVLAWSDYSELFSVAPWWESGGATPRVIAMPDPYDRATLRKLKPNIGFALPGRLGALMTPANLEKLKNGEKPSEGGGIGIDWICGFNIPVITLCALIVLNIFLQLLNLVFWWLPFVKICLPLPRRK